jgi:transcriptional regulator with XRE-family HTH domain
MVSRESPAFRKAAGARARKRREELELSQKAVALEAGYTSTSMITEFEQGIRMPTSEKLVAIAGVLRVSVDWILGKKDAPEPGIPPEAIAQKEAMMREMSTGLRAFADTIDSLCPLPS